MSCLLTIELSDQNLNIAHNEKHKGSVAKRNIVNRGIPSISCGRGCQCDMYFFTSHEEEICTIERLSNRRESEI